MKNNIEEIQSKILKNKKLYEEDHLHIKDYLESLNELAEVYIDKKNWEKALTILEDCIALYPDSYRMLITGLYRRVGILCAINFYLVSKKLNNSSNLKKFEKIKDLIASAEKEDVSSSHDIRTSDEANILNRIQLYKKNYKTNDNSNKIQKEKEDIFKKYFWSEHYENHKFSWE